MMIFGKKSKPIALRFDENCSIFGKIQWFELKPDVK